MPYERRGARGSYQGIVADIHRALAARLGLDLRIVPMSSRAASLEAATDGRCDLISATATKSSRHGELDVTEPFLDVTLVIVAARDQIPASATGQSSERRLAIADTHGLADVVRSDYPELILVQVDDADQALAAVLAGSVSGFIGTSLAMGQLLRERDWQGLTIAGKLEEPYALSIGVRRDAPLLLAAYNAAIQTLTEEEVAQSIHRWTVANGDGKVDGHILWEVLAGVLLIGALLLWRDRMVARYNRRLRDINQQLVRLSSTDQLTGVANRRVFAEQSAKEVARVERYGQALSLIITDIDYFKDVNDSLGHEAGDRVLVQFAGLLADSIRKSDLIVRWGGEEFLILCPETDLQGAARLAELLRSRIAAEDFGIARTLTASFGVASYRTGERIDALISRADRALYRAKAQGRDLVRSEREVGRDKVDRK
jgi:polar amino acid transport system substrate-binding protein